MNALKDSFTEYFANKRIQQTPYYLITLLTFNMILIVTVTLTLLYHLGLEHQKKRLIELVSTQAVMIQVVAKQEFLLHANLTPEKKKKVAEDIIRKVSKAHYGYAGFGKTGEFTLGKREGDQIQFLIKQRHYKMDTPTPVPWKSHLGEPMRRALKGISGVDVTYDYRGAIVLAAYEPIKDLHWGIVAKIDLSEIRAPYIQAAQYALYATLLFAFLSSVFFWYFLHPLIQSIDDSRRFNRMLIENSSVGLALCTFDGEIVDANSSFWEIIGLHDEEINHLNYFDLIPDEIKDQERRHFNALKKTGDIHPYESVYIHQNHEKIDVKVSGKLISMKGKSLIWLSVDNITVQKAYEHELIRNAYHDSLTALPNRLFFNQILQQTLARAERSHKPFALFFIDLNQFKEINDTHGHECGDVLLKTVAERLHNNIRTEDFVARLGGDEFVIIFESVKNTAEAIGVAKILMEKINVPIVMEECTITPSLSIGIAFYPDQAQDGESLLKCADKAMYHAKHQTDEHYFIFHP